jgi:hypothetical protein
MQPTAEKITGAFVLISTDPPSEQNEPRETLYFESSAGDGKAKYWTDKIEKAHVFSDLDDAVPMLIETNRSYAPVLIRSLNGHIKDMLDD